MTNSLCAHPRLCWYLFPSSRCFASRKINTKINLLWAHKHFTTRVQPLSYMSFTFHISITSIALGYVTGFFVIRPRPFSPETPGPFSLVWVPAVVFSIWYAIFREFPRADTKTIPCQARFTWFSHSRRSDVAHTVIGAVTCSVSFWNI